MTKTLPLFVKTLCAENMLEVQKFACWRHFIRENKCTKNLYFHVSLVFVVEFCLEESKMQE